MTRQYDQEEYVRSTEEQDLHISVVQRICYEYPRMLFQSDWSGIYIPHRKTKAYVSQVRKPYYKIPDLFISKPIAPYCGVYIELKTSYDKVYRMDGSLRNDPHITAQYASLVALRDLGYATTWGFGIDHTMKRIQLYLSGATFIDLTGDHNAV